MKNYLKEFLATLALVTGVACAAPSQNIPPPKPQHSLADATKEEEQALVNYLELQLTATKEISTYNFGDKMENERTRFLVNPQGSWVAYCEKLRKVETNTIASLWKSMDRPNQGIQRRFPGMRTNELYQMQSRRFKEGIEGALQQVERYDCKEKFTFSKDSIRKI
jgi:hypothetical protein